MLIFIIQYCTAFSKHETIHFFCFQMVSLLMIGVAAWGKWFGLVSSFRVMAAVIAVGLFLFVVAVVGLCGAVKHHQVLLFFVSFQLRDCHIYICSTHQSQIVL